jgi:prepilin-type N-terminal cleavage/methylation domain-containing protein
MLKRRRFDGKALGGVAARRARLRTPRRAGFTLLELVITMTIGGVVAAFAVPQFVQQLNQQGVSAAADQFSLAHSLARATATRFGRMAQLHIDTAAARFWVDVDTSGAGQRANIGLMRDVGTLGVAVSSTATLLCFNAMGLSTSGGSCETGAVMLVFRPKNRSSADSTVIQITALGKVLQ